jgi:hypothetical protein
LEFYQPNNQKKSDPPAERRRKREKRKKKKKKKVNEDARGAGEEEKKKKKKKKRVNVDGRGAWQEKKREMEGRRTRQGGRNRREEEISVGLVREGVEFLFAFFSLFMRCQQVNGGQKTPPFCPIRIEVILLRKMCSASFMFNFIKLMFYLVFNENLITVCCY